MEGEVGGVLGVVVGVRERDLLLPPILREGGRSGEKRIKIFSPFPNL